MKRTTLGSAAALAALALFALVSPGAPLAQPEWRQPPPAFVEILRAPNLPIAQPSPSGGQLALLTSRQYPPIADLARPMLRLAGLRIDPRTNGRARQHYWAAATLQDVTTGRELPIRLPADARVLEFHWSPDGGRFALLLEGPDHVQLWIGESASGRVRRVPGLAVNPTLYYHLTWMPDRRSLLVKRVPPRRGPAPEKPLAPSGPRVIESEGGGASSTYEARDLLTGPDDEALFEHYALSQLALVDLRSGKVRAVGEPGIFAGVEVSPDGTRIRVTRLEGPWPYTHAWYRFARAFEVWDAAGALLHVFAQCPLADEVPIHGVEEGPRSLGWRADAPATLVWLEALDGGDPGRKATHRDRVLMQAAPFDAPPREIYRAPHRVVDLAWGERGGLLLVEEYERERRWRWVTAVDPDAPEPSPRPLFDLSANDHYGDPGQPSQRMLPSGRSAVVQDGDAIFLTGSGSTPEGDRPFLDRFSLADLSSERLFRCDPDVHEYFVGWVEPGKSFLTRRQSVTEVPNYFVRTPSRRLDEATPGEARWTTDARAITGFQDPTPQLRGITKRIVTYTRADGTPLSFTLCLPPGYREGTRLPTVLDAYPLEYSDPETAGQVTGSDRTFTRFWGPTSLFFLLDGYAVLAGATMPVIGDPDTAYDTFIEQLVASAEAAIAKAAELGVTDPERVGVMGHSHGGLMTATLLAHSDLFRAGIARSGAYNHTMRPFGFQSERRTLWDAMDTYIRLSPVMSADEIDEPLLLIHGEQDQNPGTVPLQSEKLFEALRGTGGTARLVMLPYEQHGYEARESVEHVVAEQLEWFGRYVKDAPPRGAVRVSAGS
jgi:dipeptidyl aminopeptidase/acylaminoacyl peptidase